MLKYTRITCQKQRKESKNVFCEKAICVSYTYFNPICNGDELENPRVKNQWMKPKTYHMYCNQLEYYCRNILEYTVQEGTPFTFIKQHISSSI